MREARDASKASLLPFALLSPSSLRLLVFSLLLGVCLHGDSCARVVVVVVVVVPMGCSLFAIFLGARTPQAAPGS